jgi:hypothetical protein
VEGGELCFREEGRFGKPMLAGAFEGALRFNVSHSGELALYAVSGEREVGVDVEEIRSSVEEQTRTMLYLQVAKDRVINSDNFLRASVLESQYDPTWMLPDVFAGKCRDKQPFHGMGQDQEG